MSFAIITFRRSGPIKTWSALRAANAHNFRTDPIAHGTDDGPSPVLLVGSGDLVSDVRQKLVARGIDPDGRRENGVLAYEAISTASPAFFRKGDRKEQDDRLASWTAAQVAFAEKKYGDRVASMVLHLDEETPHVHTVIVPLSLVNDQRRKERGWRWSLVGATISGPGEFDKLQDEYAAAMEPFGLIRGQRHSSRKHEPYSVTMARVAERETAAADRELLARNAEAAAEQQRLLFVKMSASAMEQIAILDRRLAEADEVEAEAERKRIAADEDIRRAAEQTVAAESARLLNIKRSNELLKGWEEFNEEQAELDAERAKARAGIERNTTDAAMIADAVGKAAAFTQAFESIDRASLPLSIGKALCAADALMASQPVSPVARHAAEATKRREPFSVGQAAHMEL